MPGVTTKYSPKRERSSELLHSQTYQAYLVATHRREENKQKGKKGLLIETAKILVEDYGWDKLEEFYTIRRYPDRAEKIWHISTR